MARRLAVHEMVTSRKAPKPVGPSAHAVRVSNPGEMLFVAGQIPLEVPHGAVFTGDIKRQTELALTHVRNIVQDAKFSMDEVVQTTVYLTNLDNFDAVNAVYQKFFLSTNLPARALVGVAALPKGVDIQIDAVCIKKGKSADDLLNEANI